MDATMFDRADDDGDTMTLRPGQGLKAMLERIQKTRSPDFATAHLAFSRLPADRKKLVCDRVGMTLAHIIDNSRDPQHAEDCKKFLEMLKALAG